MLKILIVEDDASSLQNLSELICERPDLSLVSASTNYADGLSSLQQPHDVAVIDIGLPDGNGIELIHVSSGIPGTHCLVSTIFGDEATVVSALQAGADGYILKDDTRITDAIIEVSKGHIPLTPSVAVHLIRRFRPTGHNKQRLTPRESETLACLARGKSYHDTADALNISYHTVTDHVKAIYKKLSVNSRSGAVYEGLRSGLIHIEGDS